MPFQLGKLASAMAPWWLRTLTLALGMLLAGSVSAQHGGGPDCLYLEAQTIGVVSAQPEIPDRLLNELDELRAKVARSKAEGDPFGESHWGNWLRNLAFANDMALHFHCTWGWEGTGFNFRMLREQDLRRMPMADGEARPWDTSQGFMDMMSFYAVARVAILGDCGTRIETYTPYTEKKKGFLLGVGVRLRGERALDEPRSVWVPMYLFEAVRFSPGDGLHPFDQRSIEEILRKMNCRDPLRISMEQNLVKYQQRYHQPTTDWPFARPVPFHLLAQ